MFSSQKKNPGKWRLMIPEQLMSGNFPGIKRTFNTRNQFLHDLILCVMQLCQLSNQRACALPRPQEQIGNTFPYFFDLSSRFQCDSTIWIHLGTGQNKRRLQFPKNCNETSWHDVGWCCWYESRTSSWCRSDGQKWLLLLQVDTLCFLSDFESQKRI